MLRKRSLKFKLMALGVILSVAPLGVVAVSTFYQNRHMAAAAADGLSRLAHENLTNTVSGIRTMAVTQNEILREQVVHDLNVARRLMNEGGGLRVWDAESADWQAVNQFTRATTRVELPHMTFGGEWMKQNTDADIPTSLVDEVKLLVGGTCTVYQRMNAAGDMLAVATNMVQRDGRRAIGTYVPAVNPGGTANPVVAALLRGETFHGRAFVVDDWYITAFEPLLDRHDEVIGALYAGVRQESTPAMREALLKMKIGQTGYVWVIDSQGNYVLSKDGARDGENILQVKDAEGTLFVKEIIAKAQQATEGAVFDSNYPWRNAANEEVRLKIGKVTYFEPWDWIIGAGTFESEFFAARDTIEAGSRASMQILLVLVGISLAAALALWAVMAGRIGRKLSVFAAHMRGASEEVAAAAGEVSSASQSLAEGASEQAASIEETSASIEEMAATTQQNADHAKQADALMKGANATIDTANSTMGRMTTSMATISQTGEETQKIVKTIDEIAFQTNLLALNAAVEAARAGEAGAGFAVVADEVRNLAMRAAEAAQNTSRLIEESVRQIKEGADLVDVTNKAFDEVAGQAERVTQLIGEIAAASTEQAQGIGQVNAAVGEMDRVVQQNAATAEESASASEEMNAQAEQMKTMVQDLVAYVEGAVQDSSPAADKGGSNPVRRAAAGGGSKPRVGRQRQRPAEAEDTLDGF